MDSTSTSGVQATGGTQTQQQEQAQGVQGADRGLGKKAFLQLLVAQMRYQNPLKPMDNTEFIAQLAQFRTLEQMQGMAGTLETLAQSRKADLDLLGETVTATTADGTVTGKVTGLAWPQDGGGEAPPVLTIGGRDIALADIESIQVETDTG